MSNVQKSKRILIEKKLRSMRFLTTRKPILKKIQFEKNTIYSVNYPFIYNGKEYSSSGISYNSQEDALTYAIIEALERYQMLKHADGASIVSQNLIKISPKEFEIYDTDKIDPAMRHEYVFNNKSYFLWEDVIDIKNQKKVLVPAQLIYSIYLTKKNERTIRTSISTGAACGATYQFAFLKGLTEVIERDNFTLYYLTQCPPPIIDISSNKDLFIKVSEISNMLHSRILVLDLSYDFPVFVICVFLITRDGELCSIGLGSDFSLVDAIEHALLEGEKLLATLQKVKANVSDDLELKKRKKLQDIMPTNARRWIIEKPVETLAFLTKGKRVRIDSYRQEKYRGKNQKEKLQLLIDKIFNKKYNLYVKVAKEVVPGFITVKALIPQLLPLYVTEVLPYKITLRMRKFMNKKKIKTVKIKNLPPPPFL